MECLHCPINEQTADGIVVGRCMFHLKDGTTCPRHGDVGPEVEWFKKTNGKLVLENVWRMRVGKPLCGPRTK
jgi:hypothetical protein